MSWSKPKPLEPHHDDRVYPVAWEDWADYVDSYLAWRWPAKGAEGAATTAGGDPLPDPRIKIWNKDLQKKEKALHELKRLIEQDLSEEAVGRWREFGEALKFSFTSEEELKKEWRDFWQDKRDLKWNRENAFHQAKEIRDKREGSLERCQVLAKEILQLQTQIENPASVPLKAKPREGLGRGTQALRKTESKGRTLNLPSGLQVIMGKSGRDNLAVLRQARAWDLWLHLKDEAAAHAVLFRNKNQNVSHGDLEVAGQWLYAEYLGTRKDLGGGRFELLVVECRFVKPIKGDKLGRVTYHSPSVYSFAAKRNS